MFVLINKKKQMILKNHLPFYDYPAEQQLTGATLNSALKDILKKTQDILMSRLQMVKY
jgi:hypothetical protein